MRDWQGRGMDQADALFQLYFAHAEEYGPLLNLKVARKKTSAGPVPMVGNLTAELTYKNIY